MQTRSFSTPAASVLAGLALALGAGPAAAEVDEILVTAQRREESLQDVPVAVSAFTADQITVRQIDVVKDIGQNVPNLQTYTVTAGAEAIQIHSRGASVQNPGFNLSESPVGIYVDDIYYGRLASVNLDLLDVERIEVLRGPQGTLYGRNTIAGAVKIVTRTPGDESWLTGSIGIGNYETTKIGVSLGGPIEEGSLAGSIAAVYDKRNKGWMDNGTTGEEPGEYDNKAARAKLHWYGTDSFDATLTAWVADVENDGYNGIPYVPFDNTGSPNPNFDPAPANSAPQGGFYETFSAAGVNYGESQQGGANLHLSFDFGGVTLRSISSFASVDTKFGFDLAGGGADFGPVPAAQFGLRIRSDSNFDQISQELQLLGTFGDSLLWQVGGYYLNEDGQQQFSGTVPGISTTPAFNEAIDNQTDSYAAYGEVTYKVTDAFSLTGGLRWTKDEKEYSDDCVGIFCKDDSDLPDLLADPGDGQVSLKDDWDEVTFKLGADYQLTDDQLIYASYASGFQAGGFRTLCFGNLTSDQQLEVPNPTPPPDTITTDYKGCGGSTFDPQTVDSFELGWKSDLADNTLRLNVAAFYAMYQDIQQIVINSDFGFPIENIGDVDVYGLELEVTWTPISDLNVYANLGIQESNFGTVDPNSPPGGFNGLATPTDELPSNPNWQAKVGFDYTVPLQNGLEFFYGLDIFHSDSYFTEARNLVEIDDYTRLNGFLGIGADDRQWQAMLAVKNITDEEDNVSGIFANGFTNVRTPLPPTEYMLTFKVNY
ncbi:MAG: TonB-dependent receptor [Chromatiales bacterium]|nr:TonB-dependent receptor [Chromatiales bacterium]